MRKIFLAFGLIFGLNAAWCQIELDEFPEQVIGLGGNFENVLLSEYTSAEEVFWEVNYLMPESSGAPPEWSAQASDYQFEMNATVRVESKGQLAVGSDHLLAVFDNQDQLRGVAHATEVGTDWVYFLTIYSNTPGEALEYRFWDTQYGQILRGISDVVFVPNSIIGQPDDPVVVEATIVNLHLEEDLLIINLQDERFVGTEEVVLTVRALDNPETMASDTLRLTVIDDYEPALDDFPHQIADFAEPFPKIDLKAHTTVYDDDAVTYTFSGNNELAVAILDGIVEITRPEGWSGTESVLFTVRDVSSYGLEDTKEVFFTVKPEDQVPVLGSLPDLLTGLAGTFPAINLADYVETPNPAAIKWAYEFITDSAVSKPSWQVQPADFQFSMTVTARVTAYGEQLVGPDHLLTGFSATDHSLIGLAQPIQVGEDWLFFLTLYNNEVEDAVYFKLFESGGSRIFPVAQSVDFVSNEVLGDPLEPVHLDAGYLEINIDAGIATFDFITDGWSGIEQIRMVATDTATAKLLSAADTFAVEVIDLPAPVIHEIPLMSIEEGAQFAPLELADYLEGLSVDEVQWEVYGADTLSPELKGTQIQFTVPDQDYYGEEVLTVKVSHSSYMDLYNEREVTLRVINQNDTPRVVSTPSLNVGVGELFRYNFEVEDPDNANLAISSGSLPDWLFFVGSGSSAVLLGIPTEEDTGRYQLVLKADDGELSSTQAFELEVTYEYARILPIDRQVIHEGEDFPALNMTSYVEKRGAFEVFYEVLNQSELLLSFEDTELHASTPNGDWFGSAEVEIFMRKQSDSSLLDQSTITYVVINVNDAPAFETDTLDPAQVDEIYTQLVQLRDMDMDSLSVSLNSDQLWVSFTPVMDGILLLGKPAKADIGLVEVHISVWDKADTAHRTYLIAVVDNVALGTSEPSPAVLVYPNPASDFISFSASVRIAQVELLDVHGKSLLKIQPSECDCGEISVAKLPEGLYFLRFSHEKGDYLERIIKK